MVEVVVGEAAAVKLAAWTAGKAAAAHMTHAMTAKAAAKTAAGMAASQSPAAEAAAAMTATTEATTAAGAKPATTAAEASATPASPAAACKSVAGDSRAGQRERGDQGDNLMQTKILHSGIAFLFDVLDVVLRLALECAEGVDQGRR